MKKVSIIIPAYKQERTIRQDVESICNTMAQTRWDFEIIVVVDGSPDHTFNEAKKIGFSQVKVVGYEENEGKGYAVRYGMARSKGDLLVFIDAGMDIDPNGISMLLEHMEWYDADVIVGSKRHPVSQVNYPLIRRLYSWGYYNLVHLLFGLKLRDTQTGLKVFKREVLEQVLPRLVIKRFAFDIEILAVAKYLGFGKIYEAPVRINWDTHNTSFNGLLFLDPYVRGMVWDTLGVFYRMHVLKYYHQDNSGNWYYSKKLMPGVEDDELSVEHMFSIIIPVRSINDFLIESINNIKKLNYEKFEVIIILDEMEEFDPEGDTRFRVIASGPIGPGDKRNIGAEESQGDILVFLDDDAYPSEDWLRNAAIVFNENNIYALGAPAVTPPDTSILERCSGRIHESMLASYKEIYRHVPKEKRLIKDFPSVNLFVKKEAFARVGGFNEKFWPGEDTKLCLDLAKSYRRPFLYDPRPVVYHHRRKLFLPHLKQISRYGNHRGYFARRFPETSRKFAYFVPSLFVTGLLLGPIVALADPDLMWVYLLVLYVYSFFIVYEIIKTTIYELSLRSGICVGIGIFLTHVVYGLNFVIGFLKKPDLRLKRFDAETGNYIEG